MPNLRDITYDAIKQKIVTCYYAPETFLNEDAISKEIGVSRTPVREALNRLEQEGLIRIFPNRGAWITGISLSEINDIYQVRKLVEPHIILTCSEKIEENKLLGIKNRLLEDSKRSVIEEEYEIDKDIHNLILRSSDNRYFLSLMDNIFVQNTRLRILSGQRVQQRLENTTHEHLMIIEELLLRNWIKAADAMICHLENSRKAAIDGIMKRSNAISVES